jgi:hypothetical protein
MLIIGLLDFNTLLTLFIFVLEERCLGSSCVVLACNIITISGFRAAVQTGKFYTMLNGG